MKPKEYINTEDICLICALVFMALSIYFFEWVIGFLSTKYNVCQINNIYALVVAVLFVLTLFFGLAFIFYKVYCKKAEYEIERKRLEILEKHLEEMAKNKKTAAGCDC